MKKLLPVFVTLWIMALSVSAQEEETYTVVKDSSSINVDFDEYPQFPGGADACLRWLNEHVRYPIICLEQGIEGRVVVTFVIRRDGSIVDVVTKESPDSTLSKEVERVVSRMPKWKPARLAGRTVESKFQLTFTFKRPKNYKAILKAYNKSKKKEKKKLETK